MKRAMVDDLCLSYVYCVPTAITVGAQKPYAGDDSEVFETSNVYASKKILRFIKHPNIYDLGSLIIATKLRATDGSYDLGIFLDSGSAMSILLILLLLVLV